MLKLVMSGRFKLNGDKLSTHAIILSLYLSNDYVVTIISVIENTDS